MRTIAVVNQKGGCGKTTVSINLASALAEAGQRTLLVDMDPQSHCSVGLAVPEEQIEQSIYDVLISKSRNEPIRITEILWQISDKLELAPASIDLSAFEQQMAGVGERECSLRNVLVDVKTEYDYVVIDCPPAVGLLTFNALRATTDVIVPVETGYFALHGLSKQLETLDILCKKCNHNVNVRVLASMYDIRTKMAREILAELKNHFADKMFKTIVNFNTRIKEAASLGQPINEYDPSSRGHMNFHALAQEIMDSEAAMQKHELVNSLANQLESISIGASELLVSAKPKVIPVEAEIVPIEPITAAVKPEATPVETVASAVKSQAAPVETEAISAEPEAVPIETEAVPAEPEVTPIETEAVPAEPEVTPIETEAVPAEPAAAPIETENQETLSLDAKLSDYYGVSQIGEAVVFVTLYPRAANVKVAGDFNNWQPENTPLEKVGDSGIWQTKLKIPQGRYRYRLVVDGQWQQGPYNEVTEINPFGDLNSVIEVE